MRAVSWRRACRGYRFLHRLSARAIRPGGGLGGGRRGPLRISDRVRAILLQDRDAAAADALQLLGDLLMELGLHVVDQDRKVPGQLVELATNQGGREVLGDLGKRSQPVRERALEDRSE